MPTRRNDEHRSEVGSQPEGKLGTKYPLGRDMEINTQQHKEVAVVNR